jgi:hypothetical protein
LLFFVGGCQRRISASFSLQRMQFVRARFDDANTARRSVALTRHGGIVVVVVDRFVRVSSFQKEGEMSYSAKMAPKLCYFIAQSGGCASMQGYRLPPVLFFHTLLKRRRLLR